MALIEETRVFIGIEDNGLVNVRRTRVVKDSTDNDIIGERQSQQILEPGQDVSALSARIRNVCAAVWTPQVIAAYLAAKAAAQSGV